MLGKIAYVKFREFYVIEKRYPNRFRKRQKALPNQSNKMTSENQFILTNNIRKT